MNESEPVVDCRQQAFSFYRRIRIYVVDLRISVLCCIFLQTVYDYIKRQ